MSKTHPQKIPFGAFGLDAPTLVRNFFFLMVGFLVIAAAFFRWSPNLAVAVGISGLIFGINGCGMLLGSYVFKIGFAKKVLSGVRLSGVDREKGRSLDLGCGHGLMVTLSPTLDQALGIDLWQNVDQAKNHPAHTAEVVQRLKPGLNLGLMTGDMRNLPVSTGSIRLVTASWSIHNIPTAEGRRTAIQEGLRVLEPGGSFVIIDIKYLAEYRTALASAGVTEFTEFGPNFAFIIPSRGLIAVKPRTNK